MSQTFASSGITVVTSGFSAATGAASAVTAIPPDSSGRLPNYIRVSARNECYVKLTTAGGTATTNDALIQPADSLIMSVPKGLTHLAYIQGVAAGQVNVVPLENS